MNTFPSILLAVILVSTLVNSESYPVRRTTVEHLAPSIQAHIDQDCYAEAIWGIKIESIDTDRVLFEHNPHPISPSSIAPQPSMPEARDPSNCTGRRVPT